MLAADAGRRRIGFVGDVLAAVQDVLPAVEEEERTLRLNFRLRWPFGLLSYTTKCFVDATNCERLSQQIAFFIRGRIEGVAAHPPTTIVVPGGI